MIRRVQRNVDFTSAEPIVAVSLKARLRFIGNPMFSVTNSIWSFGITRRITFFNLVEHLLRLFDACTYRGTNVEAELAGVYFWEKIFAKKWRHDDEREHHDCHHCPDHEP